MRHTIPGSVLSCLRLAGVAALMLALQFACAQSANTGAISGTALDSQGSVIAAARVLIVSEDTGLTRSVLTTSEGLFRATLLPPGKYSVIVDVPGFKRKTLRSVPVAVTETAVVKVQLEVGTESVELEVRGSPELVQTETSALGRVTDDRTIVSLPLANRNFSQILALSPGVVVEIPNAGALGKTNTQNVSANGAKATWNNFQFDGVDANNLSQNSASGFDPEPGIAIPAPDTIAEFKVQTGMYDAGYGRGAGANVNVVAKSGSNALHGTLWEFFRNDALNANDFFAKRTNQPRPVLKQNQFGGSIGGPIRRNKTFFYGSYQASIQRNGFAPNVALASSLLPLLTNDRSAAALGATFCPANHSPGDPFYQTAGGGIQVACDGSNINPVALSLLNFKLPNGQYAIPVPQTVVDADHGLSTFSSPARYREDQFSANIDHNFSRRNQLAGRFFYSRANTNEPFTPFGANLPGWGTNEIERNDMFVLSDTHVFRSNLVNIARFGFMRFNGFLSGEEPISAADVGMATPSGLPEIPGIAVAGLFTIGPAGQPFYFQNTNTFVWQDTISWIRGRHSLRFGGEAKRHQVDVNVPFVTDGFLFFASLPDFLLGMSAADNGSALSNVTSSAGASGTFRKDQRYTDASAFMQDDVKITRRLTVNAGLRYEFFGPPSEIKGHLSNFDPNTAQLQAPPQGTFSGFLLPSNYHGPLPEGVTRNSNSGMWNSDYRNFAPRLGFALRLLDRHSLVLRGGYGIYYARLSGQLAEQNIGQPPFSLTQRLAGAANAAATFQQPYNPSLPPDTAYPIFVPRTPDSGLFLAAIARSTSSPYQQQYDLNLQYEFAHDFLWQIGYVGTKTTHETGCVEFNQALIATPAHPVNGQTTTTVANLPQRLPYGGVASGSYICGTTFNASYNSLQSSLTKRFSHGLDFLASYTWSRNLDSISGTGGIPQLELDFLSNDQTNPRQARGLSDFDRTHRFVLSFIYSAPRFDLGPGVLRHILSRWQFSGEAVLQSGVPVTVNDSSAGSAYGNLIGFERAQCTGMNPASSGSLFNRINGYFNPAAFTAPPVIGDDGMATGFGNCGVGIVRGPAQRNLDLGIQKNIAVTERGTLQFRGEFFNLTNTPKFGLPVNDRSAGGAFGVITSTVAAPRIVQFALKFNF